METVVATLVFALVGTAVLSGVSTAHTSGARTERQSKAENIARDQMEYVYSLPYVAPPAAYPAVETPPGYTVEAASEEYVTGDADISRVVVTVRHGGIDTLVLETLRVRE